MAQRLQMLNLYRTILRLHKEKLPPQMRQLGDDYVRNEWQLHKEVKEEPVIKHFAYRWKEYVDVLKQQDIKKTIGKDIHPVQLERLNEEQRLQLQQLKEEAAKVFES